MKKSSFASPLPAMPEIKGVKIATGEANIKYKNRDDLLFVALDEGTKVAGIFTRNKVKGEPVIWCAEHIAKGVARALVVNAGNANVFTGAKGRQIVEATAKAAASLLSCAEGEVFISSTGVIGELMDVDKITNLLPKLAENFSADAWHDAAKAIMTTDTFAKAATRKFKIGGKEININGITKGSGMIAPDMATTLSYIFTNADIKLTDLQESIKQAGELSYNRITVDSDTSTSDTLLIFATGKAGRVEGNELAIFQKQLTSIAQEMAQMVAKDGEGISKLITVNVKSAHDDGEAKIIAMAIANSPLVKTAIAGADPNWGRIAMAIGKSAKTLEMNKIKIAIGDVTVAKNGAVNPDYKEEQLSKYMQGDKIAINVELGAGSGEATVWTSDLTADYIAINADYRS